VLFSQIQLHLVHEDVSNLHFRIANEHLGKRIYQKITLKWIWQNYIVFGDIVIRILERNSNHQLCFESQFLAVEKVEVFLEENLEVVEYSQNL